MSTDTMIMGKQATLSRETASILGVPGTKRYSVHDCWSMLWSVIVESRGPLRKDTAIDTAYVRPPLVTYKGQKSRIHLQSVRSLLHAEVPLHVNLQHERACTINSPSREIKMESLLSPVMFPHISVAMANEHTSPPIVMFVHETESEVDELGHSPQFVAIIL